MFFISKTYLLPGRSFRHGILLHVYRIKTWSSRIWQKGCCKKESIFIFETR